MKVRLFLYLPVLACCSCFFSCTRQNSETNKSLFNEVAAKRMSTDSILMLTDPGIELITKHDPERGAWQNPELVIRKFGDLSNKVVADIGSGTGYFTFLMSRMAKKVLAIDIEERYLDYIEDRKLEMPIEQAEAIETRLTVENEPNLHADEVDAVLMVNVFYYLTNRADYMKIVKSAINENGLLVLVDFQPGDMPLGPSEDKVPVDEVVNDLRTAGFTQIEVDIESLNYQYIITAK